MKPLELAKQFMKKGVDFICVTAVAFSFSACNPPAAVETKEETAPVESAPQEDTRPVILFLGDSLTAGYQLDPAQAFPAHIQRFIDGNHMSFQVVNAGVSGDTSLDGLNRLDWLLTQPVHTLVLALGANDGLRGQPASFTRQNLMAICERARELYPAIRLVVAGMKMPANYGEPYRSEFEKLFAEVADECNAVFIPFILEDVAGQPALNMADGIHPNPDGHRVIARTVWPYIQEALAQ